LCLKCFGHESLHGAANKVANATERYIMTKVKMYDARITLAMSSYVEDDWAAKVARGYAPLEIKVQAMANMGLEYPVQVTAYLKAGHWSEEEGVCYRTDASIWAPEGPFTDGLRPSPNTYSSVEEYERKGGHMFGACALLVGDDKILQPILFEDGSELIPPPCAAVSYLGSGNGHYLEVPVEAIHRAKDAEGNDCTRSFLRSGKQCTVIEASVKGLDMGWWVKVAPVPVRAVRPDYVMVRKKHARARQVRVGTPKNVSQ